ncbi:hypothetical protein CMK13_00930 [Candidatus Poribacteria bacterium]|nr:hypothetical protein [Candidatus Poribacteria bacterium]OUT67897.1 MAG: hypothetical protein CBB75_00720 [bacterium TMED15]
MDLIPDLTPVLGFTDDLGVVITVLSSAIAVHVKDECRRQARQSTEAIFNEYPS